MRRYLGAGSVLLTLLIFAGCAGDPFPDPILVNVSNSFSTIQVGDPAVTLDATIANNRHNAGLSWSLTLANVNCSPACGTLVPAAPPSLTAVYTPPKTAPLNGSATITVASDADPTSTFVFDFAIQPAVMVNITNKFSTQIIGEPAVAVNVTVANDNANAGVTWTLTANGSSCSPACGTLAPSPAPSFSASYTPPTTLPAGAAASPTITATSVTQPTAMDSFSFKIGSNLSLFKGTYAFLLRGYDENHLPMVIAGSITADGQGNITGAEADIDADGGITHVPAGQTGSYTIDTSFDDVVRGTFTITSYTFPNTNIDIAMKFSMSADGTHGRIVEYDHTLYQNAGTILQQNTSLFVQPASIPAASYAFGLDSDAPVGGRVVQVGQLVLGAAGVTGGVADLSQAGAPNPIFSAAAISAGAATAPDAAGRGTLTINVNGNSNQYAYYVVNSQQLFLVETDNGAPYGTAQGGVAEKQNLPFTANTVNTNSSSVIQLTGMDVVAGTGVIGPDVVIGVMQISGGATFGLNFDSNDLGSVPGPHPAAGTVVSFDPNTGRALLSVNGGFGTGFVSSAVLYFYDSGAGFVIDADPSTPNGTPPAQAMTNNAFSGTFTPQTGSLSNPFCGNAASCNLIFGSGASATPDIPNLDGAVNLTTANSSYAAVGDLTSLESEFGYVPDLPFNGSYSIVNPALGRGTLTLPAEFFGYNAPNIQYTAAFYVIGPNQFVLIGISPTIYSGVSFFDPE